MTIGSRSRDDRGRWNQGQVTIEILADDGSMELAIAEGSAFVVPHNHWHRHKQQGVVKEMYVTPGPSDMSFAEDPRREPPH